MAVTRFMVHAQSLDNGDWRIQLTMRDDSGETREHTLSPMLMMMHKSENEPSQSAMVRVLEYLTRQIRW